MTSNPVRARRCSAAARWECPASIDLEYRLVFAPAICRRLIAAFIERAGGSVMGKISTGAVPEGLEPVYVHRQSRSLSKIVAGLLLGEQLHRLTRSSWRSAGIAWAGPSASRSRSRSQTRCSSGTASPSPTTSVLSEDLPIAETNVSFILSRPTSQHTSAKRPAAARKRTIPDLSCGPMRP
jgi:hypothetical protein